LKTICTACPERCILTEKIKDCAQIGGRLWFHRDKIICRTCPNIEESCYECTREPVQKDEVGKEEEWQIVSERLWNDYKNRHPEWKKHDIKL